MVRRNNQHSAVVPPEMLNFHFATPPPPRSQTGRSNTASNRNRNNNQHNRRSEQDRSSARRKASSSMFYLHSSANHSFALTRRSKQGYSFSGPDVAIMWDAVRIVKYLAPATDATGEEAEESCPICLDSFTCPRITKCGHCFCLPCLLRHVHTSTAANATQAVKCPCCGLPIHVDDIRPVTVVSVQTPKVNSRMKLVKVHRTKECPSPYLPQRGQWKRSSPHTAPNMVDEDAVFSRFTYVDPTSFQELLSTNHADLARYLLDLQRLTPRDLEVLFVQMSLERVRHDANSALQEMAEEQSIMERYSQNSSGMHQPLPEYLFASSYNHLQHEHGTMIDDSSGFAFQKEVGGVESDARHRGESLGSENDHRSRGESVGSEGDARLGRPNRGYSMDSAESGSQPRHQRRKRRVPTLEATLYLEENASQFYQSPDGQLCFLSKFNMNCLTADFSTHAPQEPVQIDGATSTELRGRNPLPDVVEGKVLEIESVQLTPEMRKRMPFLAHLPVFTDISFVELDLDPILTSQTQRQFKKEFEKRRQRRKNQAMAEKRADLKNQKKEQERINALKERIQRIDPTDDFFQVCVPDEPPLNMGDEFGPAVGGGGAVSSSSVQQHHHTASLLNFGAILHTPSSMAMTEEAFPSLVVSGEAPASPPSWGRGWHATNASPRAADKAQELVSPSSSATQGGGGGKGKKSKKKEKIVLFSNGGQRGGY